MRIKDILKVTEGKLTNLTRLNKEINSLKLDSRKVETNDVFICINSGVNYIEDAIKNGAICIISEEEIHYKTNIGIIKVDNIKNTLLKLGAYVRQKYKYIPLIAITGSVGKTTTKELIYNILSKEFTVLKSDGNKNNYIGVAETIFNLNSKYDICILELGMNHFNEIEELSLMVKPDISIITNIGTSHIGNLGSKKNILKAKLEILKGMDDGYLIIPNTDKLLRKINYKNTLKCYDVEISNIYLKDSLKFNLLFNNHDYSIKFPIPNKTYISNIMLAVKTCSLFNISDKTIIEGINNYIPLSNRMNIIENDNFKLVDDCYNCSYESLNGVLDYLKHQDLNKLIILGDILELGKYSVKIHKKINKDLRKIKNKEVLLVGNNTKYIKGTHFNCNEEIIKYLDNRDLSNFIILIKGSRMMKLEEIRNYIINNF